jgi:ATP-dependent helicase/nuclease subunit A
MTDHAAYAIDGAPVSVGAFYAAACDPAQSVIVEACAGAGKTWMLVSRILRALLAGAQPHEILAITFTKKAAGEMRARLDEWLTEFASPDCSDERRIAELVARGVAAEAAPALSPVLATLHHRLLEGGRTVEVRTFHAWFAQLLRAAPLDVLAELGLQPDMELVEDPIDHRAEVYRRFHGAVLADAALREDFERQVRERGRMATRRWLDAAWEHRVDIELADEAGTLERSVPPAAVAAPLARLDSPPVRGLMADVASALARHAKVIPRKQGALLESALAIDDPAERLGAMRTALLTKGRLRSGLDVPGSDEAVALLDEVEADCLQQAAHEEHLRMVRLSRVLFAEYAAYKRSRGLADMADLERGALSLLRDAPLAGWVQERLDARVRHLLIDEFQDTSPLQWHALHAWLAGYAGAGGGASGQRPPGIFIVGDPKQSIYRFRGAEPRVFFAARDFVVEGLGGRLLTCDHTRRNAPELLTALNGVFMQAQSGGEYDGFRPHTTGARSDPDAGVQSLPCVMRPDADQRPADRSLDEWRDTLTTPRLEAEELLREREASYVADAIAGLVRSEGRSPSAIHVLCRKRESLRLVAQALAARHLPFAAPEDFALIDAPEVRDLVALLDALASPSHRLSLAHALRSPVFGASDDDLIAIARAAGAGDWWHALQELPQPGDALQRARELLSRWRVAARRLPPHDLLDTVVAEGEVHARYAAAVPPECRAAALGAIDALVRQALTLDGARYATPYNFVRALKRRVLKVPAALQSDAVQLLTVHGAKGLEADIVFVMDADPSPKNADTSTVLVDWPVESEHPRHCAFVYAESRCPASLRGVLEREVQAREREELNGLYVAMTRARQRLVFSATQPRKSQPSWWSRVTPWVRPMQAVPIAPDVAAAPAPSAQVKRLPAWRADPAAAAPGRRVGADDSLASRLGQAVHRVLEWAAGPVGPDIERHATAAAGEFGVDAREVARLAGRIWRSPACRRFFEGPQLSWSGNEVPVSEGGEVLRIDRLVRLDVDGASAWWVLDYKLQHAPEALPAYREQLARYRRAVQALQPGDAVRGAFITGAGELIELD